MHNAFNQINGTSNSELISPIETYIKHGKFFHLFLKLSGDRRIITKMLLIAVCFQINTVAGGK